MVDVMELLHLEHDYFVHLCLDCFRCRVSCCGQICGFFDAGYLLMLGYDYSVHLDLVLGHFFSSTINVNDSVVTLLVWLMMG
jgi:hypothetical protein